MRIVCDMLKSAFLSISFKNKDKLSSEIDTIVDVFIKSNFSILVFVREFLFFPGQEKKMMEKALAEIEKCHVIIVEASIKAIGVGIEVGYAKALSKPIIYLRNYNSEKSTTLAGISNYIITYSDINHLKNQLQEVVKNIKSKLSKNDKQLSKP